MCWPEGVLLGLMLVSCSTPKDEAESTGEPMAELPAEQPADSGSAPEGPDILTAADMPAGPGIFYLTPSDGEPLIFNQGTCQHFRGSTNFRMFWRDRDRTHTYVLSIEVMSIFEEAGSFSQDDGMVRVKLQEEAPQSGAPPYTTDANQGDTTQISVAYIDEDVAWGDAVISGMHNLNSGALVSLIPTTLPIWCTDVEI